MVEGPAGILATAPNEFRPLYEPSKRRLTWPNGVRATTFSGDEPKQLRGPQCGFAWADEIAKWRYADAWDQLMFGLRMGSDPWCVATTTPKPIKVIRDLLDDPTTLVTHGTTYENMANLADAFIHKIVRKYEGTRLGQQELLARILTEAAGALWKLAALEISRVQARPLGLTRIVVAVDPAVTANEEGSSETGIVVAGIDHAGHGFVLDDLSGIYTPDQWAKKARWAFHNWSADRIVAERNNGGDLVERNIRMVQAPGEFLPVSLVWASRGKQTRAEPISALWEQKRGHMVGSFGDLESQLCTWEPGDKSPDRLDAMVWAFTELFFSPTVARDLGALPMA
jgi:phage terminase large subunit-like protein